MQVTHYIFTFIKEVAFLFNEMAIYLLLGFALAGLCRVVFSDALIMRFLGKKSFKSNLFAALFGVPLPLCSCGVVPAGVSLYKQGASKGATVSFLTSTPQTGIDSIFVTYGFLGLPFALFKVVSAFVTGVLGGVVTDFFVTDQTSTAEKDKMIIKGDHSRIRGFVPYLNYSFYELVSSLRKWLIIGILIGGGLAVILPNDITKLLGISDSKIIVYLLVLSIAAPMYVCASASVPIAAMLLMKGFSPGSALVFLMAGPATNAATMTVLWKILGPKTWMIYMFNIFIGSIFFAYLFDAIYPDYAGYVQGMFHHHQEDVSYLKLIGSVTLFLLIVYSFIKDYVGWFFNKF